MTLFHRFHTRTNFDRSVLLKLLLWLLIGSVIGGFCVSVSGYSISTENITTVPFTPRFSVPRVLLIPSLMAAALLFHCRRLFSCLFFCRGFTASCVLCASAAAGIEAIHRFLPGFLFEILLPLPALLLLGALWDGDAANGRTDLSRLFLFLLPVSIGLLLERLIYS